MPKYPEKTGILSRKAVCGWHVRFKQLRIVQFLTYFDQFSDRVLLRNVFFIIKWQYYLISVSHWCIITLLSCWFFVAIKLYNKASDSSIPFGKKAVAFLFRGCLNATAPWFRGLWETVLIRILQSGEIGVNITVGVNRWCQNQKVTFKI